MERFPFFSRLLFAIFMWRTPATFGERIWSRTESGGGYLNITDGILSSSPFQKAYPIKTLVSSFHTITSFKLEKAILTLPNPVHCYKVKKEWSQNVSEIMQGLRDLENVPDESLCQTSLLSDLLNLTGKMIPPYPYCAPSWAGLTVNASLTKTEAPGVQQCGNFGGSTELLQKTADGKWTTATGSVPQDLNGVQFETTAGKDDNWILVVIVDRIIATGELNVSEVPYKMQENGTGRQNETHEIGQFFIRIYTPIKNGTSSFVKHEVIEYTGVLNLTGCGNVFVANKLFEEFAEAWTDSRTMTKVYVLLFAGVVPSVILYIVLRWLERKRARASSSE